MTIEEVQSRLDAARSATGTEFRITIRSSETAFLTEWPCPADVLTNCHAVGTVAECLAALDERVAEHGAMHAIAAE
ncbi:hypothetical protein [Azospirillum palustre]